MWGNFLAMWPWRPSGWIWKSEEDSQNYSMNNIQMTRDQYAYYAACFIDGVCGDDSRRGGSPFWIWKDWIVGRDQRHLYEQAGVNEAPVIQWSPSMSQLTNAIHSNIVDLWEQIAETQSSGGWTGPE